MGKKSEKEMHSVLIRIEKDFEEELRQLARVRSIKEKKDYSIQNLIIECVIEKYGKNNKI